MMGEPPTLFEPHSLPSPAPPAGASVDGVRHVAGWLDDADQHVEELNRLIRWEQPTVTVYGRQHPTPRLSAWFGDRTYSYSGFTHRPAPFPAAVAEIGQRLRAELGVEFNSCLAQLYRNGSDSMGAHADDEWELGPRPVIASVSLGASRRFVMVNTDTKHRHEWLLGGGDLLVMSGDAQRDYRHSLPKTTRTVGPRLNLTFRRIIR